MKKRYVIVGASHRCYFMFVRRLVEDMPGVADIVGVYDTNPVRSKIFKDKIGDTCTVYDDYDVMLDTEKPDSVIVATTDEVHHEYIIKALDRGYDVICEKPMTNTFERCLAVREAEKRSGKQVRVTFNCRFMPYFAELKKLMMADKIGKVLAINYEYCLDRWHGGDYMKRWHRFMNMSQGLLVHKSTHHFDIINWILADEPAKVTALANQVYYNDTSKCYSDRCTTCEKKDECESYVRDQKMLKELYYDAEHVDGYIRDVCSFKGDADIYDNMSVSVMYTKGTILTYTLNMFSEHEGYRMVITGEKGVIIANCWDSGYGKDDHYEFAVLGKHGETEIINIPKSAGTHNGGDERLVAMLFGGVTEDPLGQYADSYAGSVSAMIGIAANESIATGKTVDVKAYLDQLR